MTFRPIAWILIAAIVLSPAQAIHADELEQSDQPEVEIIHIALTPNEADRFHISKSDDYHNMRFRLKTGWADVLADSTVVITLSLFFGSIYSQRMREIQFIEDQKDIYVRAKKSKDDIAAWILERRKNPRPTDAFESDSDDENDSATENDDSTVEKTSVITPIDESTVISTLTQQITDLKQRSLFTPQSMLNAASVSSLISGSAFYYLYYYRDGNSWIFKKLKSLFNQLFNRISSRANSACHSYKGGKAVSLEKTQITPLLLTQEDLTSRKKRYFLDGKPLSQHDLTEGLYFQFEPQTILCRSGWRFETKSLQQLIAADPNSNDAR